MSSASAYREHAAAVIATLAAVAAAGALALAISQGWTSGDTAELLLAATLVVVAVCVGWLLLQALVVLLGWAGTLLVAPARPFGLERILVLMELQALEREAPAASPDRRELAAGEALTASGPPSGGSVAG